MKKRTRHEPEVRQQLIHLKNRHPELFWVGMVSSSITITKEVYYLIDSIVLFFVR